MAHRTPSAQCLRCSRSWAEHARSVRRRCIAYESHSSACSMVGISRQRRGQPTTFAIQISQSQPPSSGYQDRPFRCPATGWHGGFQPPVSWDIREMILWEAQPHTGVFAAQATGGGHMITALLKRVPQVRILPGALLRPAHTSPDLGLFARTHIRPRAAAGQVSWIPCRGALCRSHCRPPCLGALFAPRVQEEDENALSTWLVLFRTYG